MTPDVRSLMSRVSVEVDEALEGLRTTCAITLSSGKPTPTHRIRMKHTVPINEQTAKLVSKFRSALKTLMAADQIEALLGAIEGLDCLETIDGYMALTELK